MKYLIILAPILYAVLILIAYKKKGLSYSYISRAVERRGKKQNIMNHALLPLLDRALLALLIYRINNLQGNPIIGRVITNICHFITGVEIYHNAKIGYRVQLWHGQGTVIGQSAVIGDDCLLLHQVTLGSGYVRIGNNVKIGAGAKILGNVSIGENCIIGANCVITKDIEASSLIKIECSITKIEDPRKFKFGTKIAK